jgi:hypothetical protein
LMIFNVCLSRMGNPLEYNKIAIRRNVSSVVRPRLTGVY